MVDVMGSVDHFMVKAVRFRREANNQFSRHLLHLQHPKNDASLNLLLVEGNNMVVVVVGDCCRQ